MFLHSIALCSTDSSTLPIKAFVIVHISFFILLVVKRAVYHYKDPNDMEIIPYTGDPLHNPLYERSARVGCVGSIVITVIVVILQHILC